MAGDDHNRNFRGKNCSGLFRSMLSQGKKNPDNIGNKKKYGKF